MTWRREAADDAPPPARLGAGSGTESGPRALLVLGFLAAGVLFLAMASLSTSVVEIPLTAEFGLFQLLPPSYWVGMALLLLASTLSLRHRSNLLFVVAGATLLAALAGTPSLFEPYPRYLDSYLHFSEAQAIQSSGHLPDLNVGQYSANWPGAFLLLSMLSGVSGIPPILLLAVYPFVSSALTFLAAFAFLGSVVSPTVARPGALLAAFTAVWAQFHVSPQSLGFILALLILGTLWRRETRMRILNALLFVGLVLVHPTSTLILLCILAVMTVFGLYWARASPIAKDEARFTRRVTVAYAIVWLAWLYFHATSSSQVAETAILTRMGALVSLPDQTVTLAASRTAGNLFVWAPRLRLASLAVLGAVALVALLLLRRDPGSRPVVRFAVSAFVALGLIAGADILGFGGQYYDRSLLLFTVVAPALGLAAFHRVPRWKAVPFGVAVLLVGASAAAASTAYYQEAFNVVPAESLALSEFVQRAPDGSVVVDGMFPQPVWIDPADRTLVFRFTFLQSYPAPLEDIGSPFTAYAVFDRTAELWYLQWTGEVVIRLYDAERVDFGRIYDNGYGSVYLVRE